MTFKKQCGKQCPKMCRADGHVLLKEHENRSRDPLDEGMSELYPPSAKKGHLLDVVAEKLVYQRTERALLPQVRQPLVLWQQRGVHHLPRDREVARPQRRQVVGDVVPDNHRPPHQPHDPRLHLLEGGRAAQVLLAHAAPARAVVHHLPAGLAERVEHRAAVLVHQRHARQPVGLHVTSLQMHAHKLAVQRQHRAVPEERGWHRVGAAQGRAHVRRDPSVGGWTRRRRGRYGQRREGWSVGGGYSGRAGETRRGEVRARGVAQPPRPCHSRSDRSPVRALPGLHSRLVLVRAVLTQRRHVDEETLAQHAAEARARLLGAPRLGPVLGLVPTVPGLNILLPAIRVRRGGKRAHAARAGGLARAKLRASRRGPELCAGASRLRVAILLRRRQFGSVLVQLVLHQRLAVHKQPLASRAKWQRRCRRD